jgi:hypothetical protein
MPSIIKCLKLGWKRAVKSIYPRDYATQDTQKMILDHVIEVLEKWNYRFDLNEQGAALFLEFEF